MHILLRNLTVALVAWTVWLSLVALRVRLGPDSWVQTAFVLSTVAALVAAIRANAALLPQFRGRRWRWLAIVAAGTAALGAMLTVGHVLGRSLEAAMLAGG